MEPKNITSSLKDTLTEADRALNENDTPPEKQSTASFLGEIIRFGVVALIIVLPIRMFIAQPFIVSGASMETTFSTGQYIIVDQLSYRFDDPARGDIIVFRYPKDTSKFFIKRVIGIPGDTIEIEGREVKISNVDTVDGVLLTEPYVLEMNPQSPMTEVLKEKEYFVMGDNRNASSDSRTWGILPRDNIIGRAYIRLIPLTKLDFLPGEYDTAAEIISSLESKDI